MEWVLYIVTNLNGDSSFLTMPAPSIDLLPLSKDLPSSEQVGDDVIFDGSLEDLVGAILHNAVEQVKHNAMQDRVI